MQELGKWLFTLGLIFSVLGLIFWFGSKWLPLGKLPGDFSYKTDHLAIYFPLMTMLIITVILNLLIWLFLAIKKS